MLLKELFESYADDPKFDEWEKEYFTIDDLASGTGDVSPYILPDGKIVAFEGLSHGYVAALYYDIDFDDLEEYGENDNLVAKFVNDTGWVRNRESNFIMSSKITRRQYMVMAKLMKLYRDFWSGRNKTFIEVVDGSGKRILYTDDIKNVRRFVS